jgi:hypothetical protein
MKFAGLIAVLVLVGSSATLAQGQAPTVQNRAPAASGHDVSLGFQAMDNDRSEKISLREWTTAGRPERGFHFMDTNKDGTLTQAEFSTGLQRVQERRATGAAQRN